MKEEQQLLEAGRLSPGQVETIRDGSIDFSRYSIEQLNELRFTLNRETFPLNYANLVAELAQRAAPVSSVDSLEAAPDAHKKVVNIRFTAHDGLRGWLEAKSRRLTLYGAGFVEVRSDELALGGWQRNWLGVAQRSEVVIPLQAITDAVQGDGVASETRREADWVRFRYQTALGYHRFVEFQAESIEQAGALVESLPAARSVGYERWTEVREFDARLREAGARPWISPTIVSANVAIFATMAFASGRVDLGSMPQMMAWGANFAPLTLHGQWWRLLSAPFLHGSIAHVFFNMWALWNVGRLTERLYGNWTFACLYFACGVLSGLASIAWDPTRATLGASGAIFGIFAAFIVFSLHSRARTRVVVPVSLWVSTLVFALYNLGAGFLAPGIDNAAHVGGVISGALLGMCLMRPLDREVRRRVPVKNIAAATVFVLLAGLATLWQATGLGDQLTGSERYARNHLWFFNGEVDNLRKWQEIAARAGSGQLSNATLGERLEQEIVPFWESASTRLKKDERTLPADERTYGSLIAEYAGVRLEWAHALVAGAAGDADRFSDATRYETDSERSVADIARVGMLASLEHRPRALANSPWMVAARDWVTGLHWKCVEEPSVLGATPAPTDSPEDGPMARHNAGCLAQKLFMSGDYAALDRLFERSNNSLADLPDGGSTLDGVVRGMSILLTYRPYDVAEVLGRTADWQRRVPKSIYPQLIQILMFDCWAWDARGRGTADSVSPQAWFLFAQRTEMAAMGLREIVERANTNPIWYQLSLDVGLSREQPRDELVSIFHRGIVEAPDYGPLYSRMLRILMPRWGGSYEKIRSLVHEMSTRPNEFRDFPRYTRLFWSYSSLEDDDVPLFDGSLAVWSTMREGFAELQHRYPRSDFILNAYAKFACMAQDAATYADLRPKLRDHISSLAWSRKVPLKLCDERFPVAAAEEDRRGRRG